MSNYSTLKNTANIIDLGTEGTRIASGTTAQRGSTAGQVRYNNQTNQLEYYNGSAFQFIDKSPTVSGISPTLIDTTSGGSATTNIVVTGTQFTSGGSCKAIGTNGTEVTANSVALNSSTQITATFTDSSFSNSLEPYDIKVINADGLSAQIDNVLNVDSAATFSTSSGSLGTLNFGNSYAASNLTAVVASDAEGESISMSIVSGSIPGGLTFNSNGTWSGTANLPGSNTTYNFTVRAASGTLSADRAFSIAMVAPSHQRFLGGGSGNGGVVSGYSHSSVLGHHNGSYLYDGSSTRPNEWHSANGDSNGSVTISFSSAQKVSRIGVYNRNDCCQLTLAGRLEGYNGSWQTIATFTLANSSQSSTVVNTTNATTAFTQVKFKVTSSNGSYSSIGEIELFKFV